MLIVFKPSGATQACTDMTLRIESFLQDHPKATVLKVKADISDDSIPFIYSFSTLDEGSQIVIAGHGCANTLLANLLYLWDRGIVFRIKRRQFGLSGRTPEITVQVIEDHFGRSVWED